MSAERSGTSHIVVWTIAVIFAMPVLYVLTAPPIYILTVRTTTSHAAPPWLNGYVGPARWLANNTPLKDPMMAYDEWWRKRPMWEAWANHPAP